VRVQGLACDSVRAHAKVRLRRYDAHPGRLVIGYGWGWVRIGRVYAMDSIAGTLDAHLKQCLARATAGWVAVMLETAGVVHLDRTPPAKVDLSPNR